jgi:hypothetical protein
LQNNRYLNLQILQILYFHFSYENHKSLNILLVKKDISIATESLTEKQIAKNYRRISFLTELQRETILKSAGARFDKPIRDRITAQTADFTSDPDFCRRAGINYSRPALTDIRILRTALADLYLKKAI